MRTPHLQINKCFDLNEQMKDEIKETVKYNMMMGSNKVAENEDEIVIMTLSESIGFVFDESIIVGTVKSDDYLGRKLIYASMMTAKNKCIFLLDQSNKISEDILDSYKKILNPEYESLDYNQPILLRGIASTIKKINT